MATEGKVPTFGFLAMIKHLVLFGFSTGGSTITAAYLVDFIVVEAEHRFIEVPRR